MANLFNPERKTRLDAPERAEWQKPDAVVAALSLRPGDVVVDIGAGTGYFTFRFAHTVGPAGKVYAVDVQQEMLATLAERISDRSAANITTVNAPARSTTLPDAQANMVFIANVAHEFDDLEACIGECARVLKPAGRLVVVDWKPEPTPVGPPQDHRLSPENLTAAARSAGLSGPESLDLLPHQYISIFSA